VEFRILGPLELVDAGAALAVPGGRQRSLLGLLVVHAGEDLRTDRLIDALWGDGLPSNPGNALQQLVVLVRRLVGNVLRTVPGGYRLEVDPATIDARRFERLAEEGQQALALGNDERAVRLLGEALRLWRGDALSDVDAPWAVAEARRLDERRVQAQEDRIDADLALGGHRQVVAELGQLVTAHPLRERFRGQLMRALAASGRQAEALEVYAAGRQLLADELGIDPSPELQAIHLEVLGQRVVTGAPRSTPPVRLPSPASSFVGRGAELDRVRRLLTTERIVTITGPGGGGKTRLAIEAAGGAADAGAARAVYFADLATVHEPGAVASSVASALEVSANQDLTILETIHAALGARPTLLVLDNCEHLLPDVGHLVHDIVTRHRDVQVLATSREPLGVDGEVVWPIPTLPVPPASTRSREEAASFASVRLFLDRSRERVAGFELDERDVPAVVRIVRDLDGLPLAIELAAARTRVLSPPELAERLGDRFRVLAERGLTRPDRQRTLWDTLEWSWGLLDEPLQRAWMAAAVPAGPFTVDLLAALLDAVGAELDALEAVTGLCDRSLLTVHERGSPTRYRMLGTLREFGAHRLLEVGLDRAARTAHASAVEGVIATADRTTAASWDVDLDLQRQWLADARLALRWRADQGDRQGVQRLAARLGWLWLLTALAPEGLQWLDHGLGRIEDIELDGCEPGAVLWAASLRVNEAPQDGGLRWAQLAVDAARDAAQRSTALATVAAHRAVSGDLVGAYADLQHRPRDDSWLEGYWLLLEGQLLAMEGRAREAEQRLERSERLLLDNGAWWGVWTAATLIHLAQLRGDAVRVQALADRALPVCARRHTPELEVELRCIVAMVAVDTGAARQADEQLAAAGAVVERTGVAMSRALVAAGQGYVLLRRGDMRRAAMALEEAIGLHDRGGQVFGRSFYLWALGHLALRAGDAASARQRQAEALLDALQRGDGHAVAYALEGLAAATAAEGNLAGAARAFGAAVDRRARLGADRAVITGAEFRATDLRLRELDGSGQLAEARRAGAGLDDDDLRAIAEEASASDALLP
jgi:predicted ATPase/DNA-binding SARP family transcriptional activator